MTNLIDDETASRYWAERDTAPEAERESRNTALMDWAKAKKTDQFRAEQEQAERAYSDLEGWWKETGAGHVFENDEDRLEVANRRYIANQFQQTPDQQGRYYPTYRDEYLQKTFGKSGLSETETFNLIRDSLTARKATEAALREIPGTLAKGMFQSVAAGKPIEDSDGWFLLQNWKERHADKLASLPEGWESAMLDRATKLLVRSDNMMRDLAPESKRAFDTLLAFARPEDAEGLPPTGRADVENLAKEFAKLDPQQRKDIYSTLYYAAEADGAGMGKGFFKKVGEGIARSGINIYNDAEMTAQDRNARKNITDFQSLLDQPEQQPDRMQTAESIQLQRDMAQRGVEENTQRLAELKALREIREIADGTIDPIKTEMDGVMGSIVQGAYDFSQSAAYTGMSMLPYLGLPAVMGALGSSNYLRMLDEYPDMDPDAAFGISMTVAAPMAFVERYLQALPLIGKSPLFNALMKKITSPRTPLAVRLGIGYTANVGWQTVQEYIQEAMPIRADQIAAAIRDDMPEFDAEKAFKDYREQAPAIFYSMLWGGLIAGGFMGFNELKRNGVYERRLEELEMYGITGEAAQDIAAEPDPQAATAKYREAWGKRTPEDIQAGIRKRAAQLEAARSQQDNPELPIRRIEENPDGTLTHIIEKPDGTVLYRTNDSDAADIALVEQTRRVVANDLRSDISIVTELRDQWLAEDPTNVAIESETTTAQQKLEKLQAAGNVAQIEELHRRIANSPYKDTPYDQINILGEATVEDLGEMVFRGVITLNKNSRPEDAREEIHHVAVRKALMRGSVTLDTLRGWLDATETALPDKFPGLVRDNENDIVESLARVQRAYEDGKINADEEMSLPASFVDYIKRMLKAFKEVLQRAVALRSAFKDGILPSEYEAFLAESVGLNQQAVVDTTRERVSNEVLADTNYSIGKKQSAGGIRFDEITKEDPKHDGSRVGTAWQGKVKPTTQKTNDGIATIKPNELEKQMAMLTQFVDGVPLPKFITKFKDAQKRMRAFIDFQKGNLLALYDAFEALSADYVIRSTHWYDGARVLAEGVRDNYRLTTEQSSAIIAVFSPMKDWFQNVAMGQRFADVMANHKNKKISKATMGGAMREMLDAAEDDRKIRKAFKQIEGRSISQLLKDKSKEGRTIAAVAVRLMSTNVHGLTHDVLSPEGESLGIRKNLDGTNKKLVWQSYTFIEKAISIYEDGSAKNISKVLGTEHKIRNFYNNIVAPTSPFGDATVDTHAVNAAVLYPMGNKGYLVGLNFGNAGVAGGGNSGIYWLFHEALREAAKERGVMPRQMQSITWEAIRGLFTDIRKRDKNFVAAITKIWESSKNADSARTQIIGLGITPPEWARVAGGNPGSQGGVRGSTGQVADPAGSVQPGVRQGRKGGDRGTGVANYSIGNGENAITASQKIARDLGASSRAIQEAQPGTSARDAELQAIRDSESIPWYDIGAFGQPDTVASEHQIWFDEGQVYKATAYGRFGHSIEKGPGNASPLEYLRRIAATNEAFDDSARIVGKFEDKDGNLGLIHVQDFIAENPENPAQPTPKQIIQFLESRGFFPAEGRPTNYEVWINPDLGIEVTDLHPGNLIVDANGKLVPIDVIANKYDSTKGVNYSIASQSEIDRVSRALGGMNRGPDERLKVYERARAKFGQLLKSNKEAIDAIKSARETDTAPALEQVETERASNLADLTAEESAEVAKALQDNADTFMPRIEAAATPVERKRVERDANDRAKILEQGIRDKYKEQKKAIDTKANSQSQQIKESAANRDSASRARMTEKVRRTKLLQSIGELDAVLSVLPPEIRGKVGGFAVLANIGTGDKALSDFFVKRIEMIDRQLERTLRKEYDAAFRKLLDRTKPKKAAPGEKPKGIGADIQDLFTVVRSAVDMDAVSVAAHIAGLDAKIASGELTPEQEARAQVEAALVSLVGDWRNADADRRRSALNEATRIWSGAYAAHTQKVIQLREQREVARLEAIQATGKSGELAGRKSKAIADSGLKGSWKDYILNLLNFDQVTGILFGENSDTANTMIDRQRIAENAKDDGQQAKMQALEDYFTELAGGNLLAGEQLRYNLAQPSMEVQGIKLSELEGLSAAMMWEQEDGRRHMTGELDETGKPSGSWHYDQDFVDEIIANLSPEALQLRDWLLKQYADEYGNINAVYAELNGVNLPQIRNYSPVTVQPISAPTGQVLDPVSGSAMSGASTSPGALRTRGTAIAEPRFADVLQTYISHTLQMEHWKAFAPFIAEVNGVLRNRDVQNSVEEKGGAEARKILNAWLDYFAQGGTRDAGAHLALNQGISNVLGRASQVALIGRVSTLLIQSTQLGAALAEMPTKAYLKRMGKLLTGQLGWDAALNSPYIQRRIAQMPPVVQMAMKGLKGAKPTAIQQAGKRLGMLLSGADGLFTAGTYAITYDYHLTKAQELGLTGAEAESYARNIAERVTDRIAQPTRPGARSLFENTSTHPMARAGWAFASEARKNLALVAYSFAERDTATKIRTMAYVVVLNSVGSAILRSIWRDILDDEDDELFDDKYWSLKRMLIAVATEPLYGFPVLGSTVENAINKGFGEYQSSGTLFDVDRAINPFKRIPEYMEGDFEMRDVMRDIDMIVSAMGLAHPNIAAAASITHLAKDLFSLGDSAVDAVTEE